MDISEIKLAQIKRKRILIVDDLPQNLQVLGNTLRQYGFQIAFATSGKQALNIAALKLPHLILLDMAMPEMDGLAVCKKLKEDIKTKNIPVIFLTARTESESIVKALKAGGSDYVVKPFDTDDLIGRILFHLGLDKSDQIFNDEGSLTSLIDALTGDQLGIWENVKSGLFIDDVIGFAKGLEELAKEHNSKMLLDYGEELFLNADRLNIAKMTELIDQYPVIIKKLNRQ
ncbi:MAG: response regulator [Ignavibacteria bacterium]|jgi:CheY-like chemotaxis protein|nr:response regulator [Ignavibacteria bacterium]MCU7504896.1 response regulator [Ignavibacteria bacterium]MCU7517812.1 response regulator [Ignavibacteria bacterium]